jgi:hypothetical protein
MAGFSNSDSVAMSSPVARDMINPSPASAQGEARAASLVNGNDDGHRDGETITAGEAAQKFQDSEQMGAT